MTKLLDHLPAFYKEIKEFQDLSQTVTVEYVGVESSFESVENDQFILTSSETGIERREKDFGIIPDKLTETLPFRKKRLLARMQENVPYVEEYLRQHLGNLVGHNQIYLNIDILLFELDVILEATDISFYDEIDKMLERLVPLNIVIKIATAIKNKVYLGSALVYGEHTSIYPWTVTELNMHGNIHTGALLQTVDEVTIYPVVRTTIESRVRTPMNPIIQGIEENTIYPN